MINQPDVMIKALLLLINGIFSFHHEMTAFGHVNLKKRWFFTLFETFNPISMKAITNRIAHFLASNTVWMFLTALLFIDYLMILESPQSTGSSYLVNIIRLGILFAPVLLFTGFRTWLQQRLPPIIIGFLWLFCFMIYPFLLANWLHLYLAESFILSRPNVPAEARNDLLLTIGIILLVTELAIQFNNNLSQWINKIGWIQKIGLERGILSVILLLSIISGIIGVIEVINVNGISGFAAGVGYFFKFLFFTIQFILIGLVYYFFYYANHYILIPKVLKRKGVIYYGFSVAALILIFYPIFITLIRWLPVVQEVDIELFVANGSLFARDGGGTAFMIMILSVPIIISNEWFRQAGEIATLAKEKSETELNLLKQQINPHFFFNTLNNLYALSLKKADETPEVILQLAELMRYVIYRGKEEVVSLAEEVKHIEDYIYLQQLRMHQKLDFRFEKDMVNGNQEIPPLLFIILVENAFKHGIEPAENASFLHICLKSNGNDLLFTCENSFEEKMIKAPGIGLQNLKRRLALRFPNQYNFQIEEGQNRFKVTLKITLS